MLRPATPLAIALFAAFAMLLLSVLSTPIIQAIPLGEFKGVTFGVFGFCDSTGCSPIEIGYETSQLSALNPSNFNIDEGTRTTLSTILIVHPIACLLVLIMLIMAIAAHFHAPSHSSRYLLVVLIFGLITFIVCLLAFLIDVLLFVPHMAWGSYIVLAATVLVFLSFVVSCAMRRTIVSRKASKARIAENAEMSGENYYNRQAQTDASTAAAAALAPTVPSVSSGQNGGEDKLPTFSSFEQRKDERVSDERIPLTARSPSDRSPNNAPGAGPMGQVYNNPARSGSQDPYGNPAQAQDPYAMRRGPSVEGMNARGRGPPPPGGYRGRGRGGYPPRGGYGGYGAPPPGRGGYGPSGRGYGPPPPGRGGYGAPRGGYGPPAMMRGGRPQQPRGYAGPGPYDNQPAPSNAAYAQYNQAPQAYPQQQQQGYPDAPVSPMDPQDAHDPANISQQSLSTGTPPNAGFRAYTPDRGSELPRAESPPPLPGTMPEGAGPVGQAIEMDATTGSPAHPPQGFGDFNTGLNNNSTLTMAANQDGNVDNGHHNIRDSDTDVAGFLALQQTRADDPQLQPQPQRQNTVMSDGSRYSQDTASEYVPARQAWARGPGRLSPGVPSSAVPSSHAVPSYAPVSTYAPASTLGIPSPLNIPPRPQELTGGPVPQNALPASGAGGQYYEDIDPRFVEQARGPPNPPLPEEHAPYDDPHAGAGSRSPAISERSGFTSVSQRSINPRWNPHAGGGYGQMPPRRPVQQRNEVNILNSNPDFTLPSGRGGNMGAGPGKKPGMIPGSAYPAGAI